MSNYNPLSAGIKKRDMKDTGYSIRTVAQKQQDDHNRMMIAAKIMAGMVTPNDISRDNRHETSLLAKRAVELADELIKASKQ